MLEFVEPEPEAHRRVERKSDEMLGEIVGHRHHRGEDQVVRGALLALARTRPTPHQISARLWVFYRWCADTDIAELHRLATTVRAWWPQIEAFIHTGVTNAASEGVNRLIKLEARNAFGFRNPVNQRLRSRCASIRAARRRAKPG